MEQYKKILRSKEVILVSYAKEGPITHNHLKVRERELDVNEAMGKDGSSGNVLLQKLWVSVDPGIRQLMKQSNDGLYLHSFNLDQPISCSSISKVMASADPEINVGDIVWGISDVSEYTVVPAKSLRKVDTNAAPQSAYLGLLVNEDEAGVIMDLNRVTRVYCMGWIHVNWRPKAWRASVLLKFLFILCPQDWKQRYGVRNLLNLVGKCAKVEGFMPFLDLTRMDEFIEEMKGYMRDGKVKYREDVKQGLESFLEAFNSMYSSANVGKTLLQLPST